MCCFNVYFGLVLQLFVVWLLFTHFLLLTYIKIPLQSHAVAHSNLWRHCFHPPLPPPRPPPHPPTAGCRCWNPSAASSSPILSRSLPCWGCKSNQNVLHSHTLTRVGIQFVTAVGGVALTLHWNQSQQHYFCIKPQWSSVVCWVGGPWRVCAVADFFFFLTRRPRLTGSSIHPVTILDVQHPRTPLISLSQGFGMSFSSLSLQSIHDSRCQECQKWSSHKIKKKTHSSDRYVSGVNFRLTSWMWWVIKNKQLLSVVEPITLQFLKRLSFVFIWWSKRSSRSLCHGKGQNMRESKIKKKIRSKGRITRSGGGDAKTCAKGCDYSSSQKPQVKYNEEITLLGGARLQEFTVMNHYSLYKYIWVNKH